MNRKSISTRGIGLILGVVLFGGTLIISAPAGWPAPAWSVAGIGILMAAWWMTEAIPIAATALVPIVLFPLVNVASIEVATAPYAHPMIFLFLGGFLIAEAIQQSGLHKRIALFILVRTSHSVSGVIVGFMLSTALLSMWVSNTATTIMMLPIAISVIEMLFEESEYAYSHDSFSSFLLLAVAYSASLGGIGTLIGTPPNAFMAAFLMDTYGIEITFASWLLVGLPVTIIGLPIVFFVLRSLFGKLIPKELCGGPALFQARFRGLGAWSTRERRVAILFAFVAASWIFRPLLGTVIGGLSDSGIAIAGAVLLFVVPSGDGQERALLSWNHTRNVPWGVLILVGGGLALARGVTDTGLATQIGVALSTVSSGQFLLTTLLFVTIIIILTEMTSNLATAAAFLPIVGAVAISIGADPIMLIVPAGIAASCAFMLPVATPPNAIVFGSGKLPLASMIRTGVWLNIIFALAITAFAPVMSQLLR